MTSKNERTTIGIRWAYASPALPIAAMGVPIAIYLPPFYAHDMGLGLSVVGLIFMLTRIWDVITDPVLGGLSDRFPSRWGRRRHWVVLSVPIMLVSTWMLYMPNTDQVTSSYLLVWMLILYVAWTLLSVSHQAWGAELTHSYNERSRIYGTREIALLIGGVLVLVLPSVVDQIHQGDPDLGAMRMASMGWLVIVLLPPTVFWAVVKAKENPSLHEVPKISFTASWQIFRGNPEMRRILASALLNGVSNGVTGSLLLFLAADVLKLGGASSLIVLVYFMAGIFYIPIVVRCSEKFGKHRTMAVCVMFYAITINALWILPEGSVLLTGILMAIYGIYFGAPTLLMRSMTADIVDDDTLKTGTNRTGLYYALYSMVEKVGNAVAIGLAYLALDYIGFVPGALNSADVTADFMVLMVIPPVVLNILIGMIIYRFSLDKERQEENRAALEARTLAKVD